MSNAQSGQLNPVNAARSMNNATLEGYRRQVARLPMTMQPALNQQLSDWANLFPYEQKRAAGFLGGIASYSPAQLDALTQSLRTIESRMGVKQWDFNVNADTMENASLLARSSYYAQWRGEVQRVFTAIEAAAPRVADSRHDSGRVVLLILPASLPVDSIVSGKPWDTRGVELHVEEAHRISDLALHGESALPALVAAGTSASEASADTWLIDADAGLGGAMATAQPPAQLLEYSVLKNFRDEFLRQVNTVPKDISATDQILAHVRSEDWNALWPASLKGQDRLRRFVVDVFLSGNGALIFSNAFVQWSSSEALRRARPRLLVSRFGLRSKPKPFSGIAIFENQQKVSALRDEMDPVGSAIDARILARYIWLSVMRYPERDRTCCVCVSESSGQVYVIAPPEQRPDWLASRNATPEEVCAWMHRQLSDMT